MDRDLENIKLDWQTKESFAMFKSIYPNDITPTVHSFVSDFLKWTRQRMHKNMN